MLVSEAISNTIYVPGGHDESASPLDVHEAFTAACSPGSCVASDQCHLAGICDLATGLCSNPTKPDGAPCDDGNACTTADTCSNGTCVGGPATANGTACSDADACTTHEACKNGVCIAGTAWFTGNGQFIDDLGNTWMFGFVAKGTPGVSANGNDSENTGTKKSGQSIKGPVIEIVCATATTITFRIKDKATQCTWEIEAQDNGPGPGTDRIRKTVATQQDPGAVCPTNRLVEGTLTAGDIQAH